MKFSDSSLREIRRFAPDPSNTPTTTYLILKTGGGPARQGLGLGIHWHVENRVRYYRADRSNGTIPCVRVYNDDGTLEEYVDVSSGLDPKSIAESDLEEMDCITCHNRITHRVDTPEVSLDRALSRRLISSAIPEIRRKGVEVLRGSYGSQAQALEGIAALESYYRVAYSDFYSAQGESIRGAIAVLQEIYTQSVFQEQRSDWNSHPNHIGHRDSPGCFRCHDGKHLNEEQQAIRLECDLCHSIPVVVGAQGGPAEVEISGDFQPEMHRSANWIGQHAAAFDDSCARCHDTANPGGSDDSSFCSNSACHGTVWTYAGLGAPGLREILLAQIASEPTPAAQAPAGGGLSFSGAIGPLFADRCGACHGEGGASGLKLTAYAGALAGGDSGPVLVPGDPQASRIVQVQSGNEPHFGQLSADELERVVEWIRAGAPEG